MPTDFYDVLGAPADASSDELKRAYRSRVREYHPDVNDHPEGDAQFKLIRRANDVLTDAAERKDYDRMGHREYTNKRLDDLPPFSVFPEFEDAAGESPEETDHWHVLDCDNEGPEHDDDIRILDGERPKPPPRPGGTVLLVEWLDDD
mgnify:CR=1 FL=1